MNHDVFYVRETLLYGVMYLARDLVAFFQRKGAVGTDLDIYIDLISELPGVQQIDLLDARDAFCALADLGFGFRGAGAVDHFADGVFKNIVGGFGDEYADQEAGDSIGDGVSHAGADHADESADGGERVAAVMPGVRHQRAGVDASGEVAGEPVHDFFYSNGDRSRHQRQTTNVFEMATAITNQTAIQCIAMQPNNLENDELTFDELQLLRELPTTWDETRFIDGYPGRYVVLARRHGDKWYVAGLNATDKPIKMTVDLSEMGNGQPVYYTDSKKGTEVKKFGGAKVRKDGSMKVEMQPNGGFVVVK